MAVFTGKIIEMCFLGCESINSSILILIFNFFRTWERQLEALAVVACLLRASGQQMAQLDVTLTRVSRSLQQAFIILWSAMDAALHCAAAWNPCPVMMRCQTSRTNPLFTRVVICHCSLLLVQSLFLIHKCCTYVCKSKQFDNALLWTGKNTTPYCLKFDYWHSGFLPMGTGESWPSILLVLDTSDF